MNLRQRCDTFAHWRALKDEHDAESDAIDMLDAIEREAQEARRSRFERRRMLTVALVRLEAALRPAPTKPRETSPGNIAARTEPAFPAVNRGAEA